MDRHFKDGNVLLYQLKNNPVWQARIKVPHTNRWRQLSTKESDFSAAGERACYLYDQMCFRIENGLVPETRSLGHVAEQYITNKTKLVESGEARRLDKLKLSIAKRYIQSANISSVQLSQLNDGHMRQWAEEISYKIGGNVKKSARTKMNTVMREIFELGIQHNWLKHHQVPRLVTDGDEIEVFPWIEEEDITTIFSKLERWPEQTNKPYSKEVRQLLIPYCKVLLETGMRPGTEINNLRWRNLTPYYKVNGEEFLKIEIEKSKTRKHWAVAPMSLWSVFQFLKEDISDRRCAVPGKNDFVFLDSKGKVPEIFGKSFGAFLRWIDLTHNNRGEKYVLYSFRHTYMTRKLLEERSIQFIASQCGTSVELVSTTYNHLTTIMKPHALVMGAEISELGAKFHSMNASVIKR